MEIRRSELLKYAAKELQTTVQILDTSGKYIERIRPMDDQAEVLTDGLGEVWPTITNWLLENVGSVPLLYTINLTLFYAALRFDNEILVFGPMQSTIRFRCRNELHFNLLQEQTDYILSRMHPIQLGRINELLCLLCNLRKTENVGEEVTVTVKDILDTNQIRNVFTETTSDVTSMVLENLERDFRHNPYDEEVREMAAIEQGEPELLQRIVAETYTGNVGILSDDPLRHMKNLGIVIVTLASRAAIRGGVPYEVAFSMSDRFIREIEKKKSITETDEYSRFTELQYAETVREYQDAIRGRKSGKEHEHVERCKEYIYRNLHGRIRVSEIANELALNSNYLSTIFRKCEGITISEYILRQKLVLVRNLLIYSNYSFLEITNYLGFPSQSYLGKRFREETGMTLREYRTRYRVRAFEQESGPEKL